MTDAQIQRFIEQNEQRLYSRTFALPLVGWAMTSGSIFLLAGFGVQAAALLIGGALTIPSLVVSREAARMWREYKRAPARILWRQLTENPDFLDSRSSETWGLEQSLDALYFADERAEVLPLVQGARLLVVYDSQQKRRLAILQRLVQLRYVREQLIEKAARLHELGDLSSTITDSVEQMGGEIAAIERLTDDILASCHRLEAIVLAVHRAVQVKQLHREIADLQSSVSASAGASNHLAAPDATDIERQIGREIETFLQLERETDAHLRAI